MEDIMAGHRLERTTEDIKRELTAIFRELKDCLLYTSRCV